MAVMHCLRKVVSTVMLRKGIAWDVPFRGREGVPRILVLSDCMDATYYVAFHYPLQDLQARGLADFAVLSGDGMRRNVQRYEPETVVKHIMSRYRPHVVIFSRYASPYAKELIESFQSYHVRTLYYSDDNLLDLPESLGPGVRSQHATAEVEKARRICFASVDGILVSTSHLATVMQKQFPGQTIYQLLYPPYLGHLIKKTPGGTSRLKGKAVTIGYMGSRGHHRDLLKVAGAITRILDEIPETRFETFGTIAMPEELRRFGNRVATHKPRNSYGEFMQYLHDLQWDIGLAPLEDNEFNRCRSPIKFLEYTACGVATVASDIGVYRSVIGHQMGLLVADDEWVPSVRLAVTNPALRRLFLSNAGKICADRFSFRKVTDDLARVLNLLLAPPGNC